MTGTLRGLVAAVVALAVIVAPGRGAAAGSGLPVLISQDLTTARTIIGAPFSFTTTVRNAGDSPLPGLVAHLNIVSMDRDVYVDPEDWSTHRTKYLSPVPVRGAVRLPWSVHAVNAGRFVVYVALSTAAGGDVIAGPALHAEVRAPERADAAGILTVAITVPAVLLILLLGTRYRRRRLT